MKILIFIRLFNFFLNLFYNVAISTSNLFKYSSQMIPIIPKVNNTIPEKNDIVIIIPAVPGTAIFVNFKCVNY